MTPLSLRWLSAYPSARRVVFIALGLAAFAFLAVLTRSAIAGQSAGRPGGEFSSGVIRYSVFSEDRSQRRDLEAKDIVLALERRFASKKATSPRSQVCASPSLNKDPMPCLEEQLLDQFKRLTVEYFSETHSWESAIEVKRLVQLSESPVNTPALAAKTQGLPTSELSRSLNIADLLHSGHDWPEGFLARASAVSKMFGSSQAWSVNGIPFVAGDIAVKAYSFASSTVEGMPPQTSVDRAPRVVFEKYDNGLAVVRVEVSLDPQASRYLLRFSSPYEPQERTSGAAPYYVIGGYSLIQRDALEVMAISPRLYSNLQHFYSRDTLSIPVTDSKGLKGFLDQFLQCTHSLERDIAKGLQSEAIR